MKPCFLNFLLLLLMNKLPYPGGNGGTLLPGLPTRYNIHIYIQQHIYIYVCVCVCVCLCFINLG